MAKLSGTEKQVAYAESLRAREIARLESGLDGWKAKVVKGGRFAAFAKKRLDRSMATLEALRNATTAREVLDLLAE